MRKYWILGIGLLTLVTTSHLMSSSSEAKPAAKSGGTGVAWKTSFPVALQEAKRTRKPILIDFYTTWCSPCVQMDKTTLMNATVVRESKKWITVKVDADKHEALASKYKAELFPTFVFLKPDGTIVARIENFQKADGMLKAMRAAYPKARRYPRIHPKYK